MSSIGHILIVEDDMSIRDMIEMALDEEGYHVESAANGAAALDLVKALPPDVILLDMRMPIMDGWAFARAFHQLPNQHATIIVLTAASDPITPSTEIEADGFLAKPFHIEALLDCIVQHLPLGVMPMPFAATA